MFDRISNKSSTLKISPNGRDIASDFYYEQLDSMSAFLKDKKLWSIERAILWHNNLTIFFYRMNKYLMQNFLIEFTMVVFWNPLPGFHYSFRYDRKLYSLNVALSKWVTYTPLPAIHSYFMLPQGIKVLHHPLHTVSIFLLRNIMFHDYKFSMDSAL